MLKRALEALQTADANACAMPLNWRAGDKVIVPPPKNLTELNHRKMLTIIPLSLYLC